MVETSEQKLDSQVKTLLETVAAAEDSSAANGKLSVERVRESYLQALALAGEAEAIKKVEDRRISVADGEIAIRIYTPTIEDEKW